MWVKKLNKREIKKRQTDGLALSNVNKLLLEFES